MIMTTKFDDPKTNALLTSVSGSAAIFRAVFIAYLIFAGYAGAIILSVTDRDLFLDADLTAPVLNVKFKTSYFFIVVPVIFLLLHLNLLTHMSVLVKKLNAYRVNVRFDKIMLGLLPDVLLIQSADKRHSSDFRKYFLKGTFVYGALIMLPVFILCFIWIEFLDFQSITITSFHLMVIIADVVLIRYFFPDMEEIDTSQENKNLDVRLGVIVGASIITIVLVILSFITLDYYRIHKSFSVSAYSTYINGIMELDVSGQRLYLDLESDVLPTKACKEENKTLGAVLKNRSYKGANLEGAILCHVNLMGSQLQGANLRMAELQGADLRGAQLQGVDLREAQLQGVDLSGAQLHDENLRGAELQGANLSGAELQGANLRGAQLQGAYLYVAKLQGANLVRAELQGANLVGAELQGANLENAELQGVQLFGAQLQGADLSGAQLQGAYPGGAASDAFTFQSFAGFNDLTLRVDKGARMVLSNSTVPSTTPITNMVAYIQKITTVMGEFVPKNRVSRFIRRMKESEANPFAYVGLDYAGSYTKKEADEWIKEYKEAMCKIPKEIYERRHREKLDCYLPDFNSNCFRPYPYDYPPPLRHGCRPLL